MKKLISLFICTVLTLAFVSAQNIPSGINYQAVARDADGKVLAEQPIILEISLLTRPEKGMVLYTETHWVITNQFGLFNIVIGQGRAYSGDFESVPWDAHEIWMEIAMDDRSDGDFKIVNTTKLLAVPYAFHSGTANTISNNHKVAWWGQPWWNIQGLEYTDPEKHFIGNKDSVDLVFRTNNLERLRIKANGEIIMPGDVEIGGSLQVNGDSTIVQNLYVKGQKAVVDHNLYADSSFTNFSETKFSYIDGDQEIEGNLTVHGDSARVDHDLSVGGNTDLEGNLTVHGSARVDNDLSVLGITKLDSSLVVSANEMDGDFIATFENMNGVDGDGIKIKLGKNRTNTFLGNSTPNPDPSGFTSLQQEHLKTLITSSSNTEKLQALTLLLACKQPQDEVNKARVAVDVGNFIIGFINSNLPTIPQTTVTEAKSLEGCVPNTNLCLGIDIPYIGFGPLNLSPGIPTVDLQSFIPDVGGCVDLSSIELFSLETWGLQNADFSLTDVTGTLDNENEFIQFADRQDRRMGAIRAENYANWVDNYLNPIFLWKLRGAWNSTTDKAHAKYHFKSKVFEAIPSYLNLGVEYSSGNGDYAEWLERLDPNEAISTGDIVAVKGGKITKDLTDAEQIMAVSYRPIVLGNIPPDGKAHLGNNIAFMGQIPVKIMGAVATGDYIVGKSDIPGYGIAISPKDMTIEDFKLAVGRAWETNPNSGPKMVNTVIGVHNGDYLNILKRYEQKFKASEARLESVEAKVEMLSEMMIQKNKTN